MKDVASREDALRTAGALTAEKAAKHTPGPWHATQGPGENEYRLDTTWHGGTAGIYLGRFTASLKTRNNGQSDARLIAAAPTLLERMEGAARQLETGVDPLQVAQQLRAAISLAEQGT